MPAFSDDVVDEELRGSRKYEGRGTADDDEKDAEQELGTERTNDGPNVGEESAEPNGVELFGRCRHQAYFQFTAPLAGFELFWRQVQG